MSCCQKQSQLYLISINFLLFICGCVVVSFGTLAIQLKISQAILIPVNISKSIMLIFTSLIGLLGSFYKQRKSIHILYTTTVVITFIYQLSIAAIVHVQATNTTSWLSQTWTESSNEYRLYAQTKFDCCGFTNPSDHPFLSDTCVAQLNSSLPPCYEPLNQYIQQELGHVSVGLFASLVFTLFALINSITSFYTIRSKRSWEVGLGTNHGHKRQLNQRHSSSETLIHTITPTLK